MDQIQKIASEVRENNPDLLEKETIVLRYVKRAINQIKIFCNRSNIPEELEDTVAQIVEDMLKADGHIKLKDDVASITRGNTTISYTSKQSAYARTIDFMKDYKSMLIHYRKMKTPKYRGEA